MTAANMGTIEGAGGGLVLFGMSLTGKALGIIIGLVGVGAAIYGTYTITFPAQDEIAKLESQIRQLKADISAQEANANKVASLRQQLEEVRAKGDFVLGLLPTVDSIDTLVRDLNAQIPPKTTFALPNGVTLNIDSSLRSFTPSIDSSAAGQYDTFTFNINFDSTFPAAMQAIQNIEKLQTFLVIRDIKITATPISDNEIDIPEQFEVSPADVQIIKQNLPPKVSVSFKLEAYVPKKAEAAPTQ